MGDVPGQWNEQLVRDALGVDAELALALPLPFTSEEDRVYWRPTKNGQFTVRSCYWMLRLGGNTDNTSEDIWKSVWHMSAPPKLKHFIWNALKGNMAVKLRLHQRHIVTNSNSCWQWLKIKVTKETMTLMAALMWAAWRCRNIKVFENSEPDSVKVAVGSCNYYVAEYTGYAGRVLEKAAAPSQRSATKWKSQLWGV
uniref:Reverse transcriptase zinc-binding domain-containing protein n=1 Tax=Chenopodium quinoa TaxID=63459 RepID=A0A803MYL9_CHEQI